MINYRAWDKEHYYMEYTTQNLIVTFADDGVTVIDNSSLSSTCIMMQKFDLMQSSQLFDKNNKEFYDRDIVLQTTTGKICFIEHKQGCFFINDGKDLISLHENYIDYAIIGNTYEDQGTLDFMRFN